MAIRQVRKKGDEILTKRCKEVKVFDEKLWMLLDDMYETMQKYDGVGLAAPQVGVLKRVFVVDIGEGKIEMINPQVIETSGSQTGSEGCLSVPDEWHEVTRPNKVKMRAKDRFGNEFEADGEELLARAFLHENDHLDGILFLERVDR